jgi:hypothetical protein
MRVHVAKGICKIVSREAVGLKNLLGETAFILYLCVRQVKEICVGIAVAGYFAAVTLQVAKLSYAHIHTVVGEVADAISDRVKCPNDSSGLQQRKRVGVLALHFIVKSYGNDALGWEVGCTFGLYKAY